MNYIIEPSWFYWVSILSKIGCLLVIVSFIGIVACIICWIINFNNGNNKKPIIIFTSIIILISVITTFIPSEKVMYQIMGAKLATTDNIELVKENGKELVEFLTDEIIEVINESKE